MLIALIQLLHEPISTTEQTAAKTKTNGSNFAMTINKTKGHTFRRVSVWLQEPVFTHGQLHAAASRVSNPNNLTMAIKNSHNGQTRNVIYSKILG